MRAAIDGERLFPRGGRLLLAVSGGGDSMAMLAVLDRLRARPGRGEALVVAHLNHRLRGAASDRDALFVAASARAAGLACVLGEAAAGPPVRENVEAWGRDARYALLARAAAATGADAVCVAHTADDQAETVLLRLARGAGPAALAGMRPRRRDGVVRPLLGCSRAECRAYLGALGRVFVEDATNAGQGLRSRIRHGVLPVLSRELGVDATARLARLARQLGIEGSLATRWVEALLPADPRSPLPATTVDAAGDAAPRLVHAWLARAGVRASERQVGAVARLAAGRCPSAAVDLARGFRVRRRYGELVLERVEAARLAPWEAVEIDVPGATDLPNGWCLRSRWLEGDEAGLPGGSPADPTAASAEAAAGLAVAVSPRRVPLPLRARPPRPGDRIRLAQGRRKLSDVLVDARIPRPLRSLLVVVAGADDMVVWIPGVVASPWVGAREPGERQLSLRAVPPGEKDDRRRFPGPSRRIGIAGPDRPW